MSEFNDRGDGRDWARKILRRHAAGEKINPYPLHLAREVLGVPEPEPVVCGRPGADRASVPAEPRVTEQAMTPAEAFYAAEQAARSAGGYSSAAMACA